MPLKRFVMDVCGLSGEDISVYNQCGDERDNLSCAGICGTSVNSPPKQEDNDSRRADSMGYLQPPEK